ncbi:MAG: hypothetical protein ACR2RE_10210, partial [Geminicoccaceae bacterium]
MRSSSRVGSADRLYEGRPLMGPAFSFPGELGLNSAYAALAALGRHGSVILPIGVFVGLFIPPLATLIKPLLIPGIIGPFI